MTVFFVLLRAFKCLYILQSLNPSKFQWSTAAVGWGGFFYELIISGVGAGWDAKIQGTSLRISREAQKLGSKGLEGRAASEL